MEQSLTLIAERLSSDSLIPELTEYAIRFFFWKREINPKTYHNLSIEDAAYRLQKKFPEFCLILFWHDNKLSRQQDEFVKLNKFYGIDDIMKAWWAVKYNLRGPIWPIYGYTKETYLEIRNDPNERVTKQMIEQEIFDYKRHELLWGEPITFKSGTYVVSYVSQFIKLLEFMRPIYNKGKNFDFILSDCLWNSSAVHGNVKWIQALSSRAMIGTPGVAVADSAYNIIKKYYIKKHPNLFYHLEQNPEFNIIFSDEPAEVRNIRLCAVEQERELTQIEKDYIESILNPPPFDVNKLKDKLDAIRRAYH